MHYIYWPTKFFLICGGFSWELIPVCFCVLNALLKKFEFFLFFSLLQINIFWCFWIILMRWYQKYFLKNKKNIILIHFQVKNTLKNNRNHTRSSTEEVWWYASSMIRLDFQDWIGVLCTRRLVFQRTQAMEKRS
jgi:hypothetical protein